MKRLALMRSILSSLQGRPCPFSIPFPDMAKYDKNLDVIYKYQRGVSLSKCCRIAFNMAMFFIA